MADDRYPIQPADGEPLTRGPVAAVLWGAFLGCSWTWVIGMVFPALLLRDYGIMGWVFFAIPNVLGAAMMGLVLYKPERSVKIVTNHGRACHHFTVVTVAYQLFVVAWLFGTMFALAVPLLMVGVLLSAGLGMRNRRSAMLYVAVGLTLVSWGCFSWATKGPGAWGLTQWAWPREGINRLGMTDLLLFAPCAFIGFALCPYLDLTFHRARINTSPGTGVAAFFFGFGIVFAMMIVFSICYGSLLLPFIAGDPDATLPGFWIVLLGLHLSLQAGFTITVHVRESLENPDANRRWLAAAAFIALLLGLGAKIVGNSKIASIDGLTGGLTLGEAGYRGFILLYGSVFPGYVWLMMIPTRGRLTEASQKIRFGLFVFASASAYLLGWGAFVMGHSWLLAVLCVIFMLARGVVEVLPREKAPAGR